MKPHFLQRVSCGWITVLICTQVLCGASPGAFVEEPADQEVNPADTVDLRCRLTPQPAGPITVLWLKDGQLQNTQASGLYTSTGDPSNFDYSIRINGATVERDDGVWECQGLVSGGTVGSRKAHVVVRQAPHDRPIMQQDAGTIRNGDDLLLKADQNYTVTCEVHEANPPAKIKWTIGNKDVSDFAHTINQTGPNSKLYNTISTLTYQYQPRDNQAQLKCDTIHAALAGPLSTYAHLNVQFAPIIQFQQEPPGDISEGQDVLLTCLANANPPASIKWNVNNNQEMPMLNETTIKIQSASHVSNGNYTCVASNDGFAPTRVSYTVAVRYPPSFVIHPQGSSVDVDQTYSMFCDAEGYPPPQIQWLQNTTDGQTIVRGADRMLNITVDYSSQGKYWCKASNTINNKDNIVLSDVADLLVKGPPKFENLASNPRLEVVGEKGGDATLTALYCSNPPPTSAYWMREQKAAERSKSQRIEPGPTGNKKYDIKTKDRSSGCYESRLIISNLEAADSGKYKYWVENEKGPNAFTTMLTVRDSVNTALIIGLVVGLGGALILALIAALCCYRLKKFCFASSKKAGSFDIEKREVKQENGTTTIETTRTVQREDNLKQNPLQTESMFIKTDNKKPNGVGSHVIMNGVNGVQNGNDLSKKTGRVDGMPAEVLHYAQLDVDGPKENGHHGPMGSPRLEVRNGHDYSDIRPTVL
ncbi:peroxidasin homolog [Paramacrobiotus metropolitanus]|uniref:peroxidasin homolog n=1 Tax=Paramacrobiotus metropolitanus TaxID=2943436 RepID=UPI0024465AA0|nr:peroxidasin homolog [Paramacrobiotus metropolitanus]